MNETNRISPIVWLAMILSVWLTGCQGDLRAARIDEREAAVNLGSDPRTLDPSLATDIASAQAISCFTRGLTTLDADGQPQPELAETWEISPDGLTYTFHLRPATWTNGEPVTAEDFVYTWTRRVLNPEFGSEYAYQLFYLRGARAHYTSPTQVGVEAIGVRALSPERLEVSLEHPAPFFLQLVAHHAYFPVSKQTDTTQPGWAHRAETYVGCGPFIMEAYEPGRHLVGRRNPDYWDAKHVALDRLELRLIEDEVTARFAFDNGEIDATASVPRADMDALRQGDALRFAPSHATYYLHFNCQRPIFQDARVRRALTLALDRETLTRNVTRAGEAPAFALTPPALYTQPPEPTFADAQFDEARRLLAEAGYPEGRGFPHLRYIYNTAEGHRQIAQVVQETWRRELGIRIAIENLEFKVLIDQRRKGAFDLARAGWVADFADPINFLEIFDSHSDNNDSHWFDPRYDALLADCRAEADPVRREARLRATERYLMETLPIIPIYHYTNPYLCAPRLKGYRIGPMGQFDAARLSWADGGA